MSFEINKIYNKNCIDFIKTLPDNCLDLIIADPPYNKNVAYWDNMSNKEYINMMKVLTKEFKRTLKGDGSVFIYNQQPMASTMFVIFYEELNYVDEIIWHYRNGGGNPKNKCKNVHQLLYWFSKNKEYKSNIGSIRQPYSGTRAIYKGNIDKNPSKAWKPNEKGALPTNVWEISIVRQKESTPLAKISVQKPLEICNRIINVGSNPNDLVYIPFAGSGSEIESCIKNNRNYIATELDNNYIEDIIIPRINSINKRGFNMGLWVMSQDGEKLVLAEQFEIHAAMEGAVIYVNCSLAGRYKSKERAMEVLTEIEDQLRKGNCFDDMYQHRRVSKQNVYHMPKE